MDEPHNETQKRKDTDLHGSNQCQFVKLVSWLRAFLRPVTDFVPVLAIMLFLGALFWAKAQDPFSRKWFTVFADGHPVKCVAVLPKPVRPCPVVIYAHGSGGTLMNDGQDLRQMAEMGLAVVSIEYNQSNEVAFSSQLESLLDYVGQQKWADTNAVAWVGFSLGAIRTWDFALQHPRLQPQLLVQLSGSGLVPSSILPAPSSANLRCPVLLIHGDQDEIFPVADTRSLATILQTNGLPVVSEILPGTPHDMSPDRALVFRRIGEYCLAHLQSSSSRREEALTNESAINLSFVTSAATSGPWQDYHSIAQWQAEAPAFGWFCLPAVAWAIGGFVWRRRQRPVIQKPKLTRGEVALRWLAAVLATWAVAETSVHLVTPHFLVSDRTLAIARKVLVQDKESADFEALAFRPIWNGQKLKTLLDHVELAGYNRQLINWQLDDTMYREQVLSPVITGEAGEQFNWRRPLWEEFYPRIRHESSPGDAAVIVVRHLRERVTVLAAPNLPHDIPDIWRRQLTDPAGFEIIYVAALRSVGVPARLDATGQAELFADNKWQPAPRPVI
jgi:dienelactone hydrolase